MPIVTTINSTSINDDNTLFNFNDDDNLDIKNNEDINYDISGWWTINSFLDFGNLGVTLCNITPIDEKLYTKNRCKYKCELISQKDKTKLNFLSATTEIQNDKILNWDIPNSKNNQYLEKLAGAEGLITHNGRFITL